MGIIPEEAIKKMLVSQLEPFADQLKGYKVFLFGSRAAKQGKRRERSDFDVGVLGKEPLPADLFFAIEDAFEQLPTLHQIDWVDFNRVSQAFKKEALKQIEVLFE